MTFPSVFKNELVCYFQPMVQATGLIRVKTHKEKKCGGGYGNAKVRRIFIFTYYLLMIRVTLQDILIVGFMF